MVALALLVITALSAVLPHASGAAAASPTFVATFHSIGIYWSPSGGSASNACNVRYRTAGSFSWREDLPLWYDSRNGEYRGSLVHLQPGTTYEIELSLRNTGTTAVGTASTWSEDFPIARVIQLPTMSDQTLRITQSGTPDGYVLYTPMPGQQAIIDVANRYDHNVEVNASYVIIRGLTLTGASRHGVRIYPPSHHVVVEECDISGWGRSGVDRDSAVYVYESGEANPSRTTVHNVVVQRNRMHDPRYGSNDWRSGHPEGPQAVKFLSARGNHVIRCNEVYSTNGNHFNDAFSGWQNRSYVGFPHAESDIYGNRISHCWDDGIEAEGGNRNVRIWGNYIDRTCVKIAIASTSSGPIYIWRNVANVAECSPGEYRGAFLKSGGEDQYCGGKIYVFHNTILQPSGWGCSDGRTDSGGFMSHLESRTNILHVSSDTKDSIKEFSTHPKPDLNDFDYDLYNGQVIVDGDLDLGSDRIHERNGIRAKPVYNPRNGAGEFYLDSSSPGYDAGVRLPNFSDGFTGAAPDMGAHEAGTAAMEFGVDAYRRSPTDPTPTATAGARAYQLHLPVVLKGG